MKYKVGDKVRVLDSDYSFNGEVGTIHSMNDDFVYVVGASKYDKEHPYSLRYNEVEPVYATSEPNTAMKHKIGDKVRITKDFYGHGFSIGKVVEIAHVGFESYGAEKTEGRVWWFEDDKCEPMCAETDLEQPAYTTNPFDQQVGGSHYKDMKIQPVEFILANELGFCEGNVIKYICRYKQKGGVQDLKKVVHYAELLIKQIEDNE